MSCAPWAKSAIYDCLVSIISYCPGDLCEQEAFENCWAHSLLLHCQSPGVASRTPAIAIAHAACDVHDINNNDNA